jgi:hypothetical protein
VAKPVSPMCPICRKSQRLVGDSITAAASTTILEDDEDEDETAVALQNIQNREQEHPHDINEVPIQSHALEEPVFMRSDLSGQCAD